MAVSETVQTLQFDAVTVTGASRWDAVVLRYDWNANTITLVVIKGTTSANAAASVPSGLQNSVGSQYDQLLALVQLKQGLSSVQQIKDRRFWAHKRLYIPSVEALPPAIDAAYRMEAVLPDGTVYRCLLNSSNTPTWVVESGAVTELSGSAVIVTASGWTAGSPLVSRCLVGPNWRQLDLQFSRTGEELNPNNDTGSINGAVNGAIPVGTLQGVSVPDKTKEFECSYRGAGGIFYSGLVRIEPNGAINLLSLSPSANLVKASSSSQLSLRVGLFFGKAS